VILYFLNTLRGAGRNEIFFVSNNSESVWRLNDYFRDEYPSFCYVGVDLKSHVRSVGIEARANAINSVFSSQKQLKEMPKLKFVSINDPLTINFDALVVVSSSINDEDFPDKVLVLKCKKVDASVGSDVTFHHSKEAPGNRLIISSTGKTNRDIDDIRCWADAIQAGIQRAQKAGSVAPVILIPALASDKLTQTHDNILKVSILATYQQIYRELQARENFPKKDVFVFSKRPPKYIFKNVDERTTLSAHGVNVANVSQSVLVEPTEPKSALPEAEPSKPEPPKPPKARHLIRPSVGFLAPNLSKVLDEGFEIQRLISFIEAGRILGRDLAGPDPERMSPPNFVKYVREVFEGLSQVSVNVKSDLEVLQKDYPLLYSVARADKHVPRHHPQVVRIEYTGDGETEETLLLVGKGVTYDTGGADIKTGGIMLGMSRDKCGAAYVAGFLLTVALLKPPNVRVIAELGVVRNSVGSEAFVSDEVIQGHSGVHVKITNTDAEGRLVMADCLSHLRNKALLEKLPNPKFMTMATLTGHAIRSFGPYTVLVDNGPAKNLKVAEDLKQIGESWGDPFEVSSLRKEDFQAIQKSNQAFEVVNASYSPSRGHQQAAAFLMITSGLSNHGIDSNRPLPYTYMDIAGSACAGGDYGFGKPTACCIVALTARYIIPRLGPNKA